MLERVPKIAVSDLKPGDAVIVAGSPASASKSSLLAVNVIAGVEPIFQSASPRQAQSLGGDLGNALGGGGAMGTGGPPPELLATRPNFFFIKTKEKSNFKRGSRLWSSGGGVFFRRSLSPRR